ncbi:50S ribosomal protein L11 methyltransferase [Formicincola oecophyllae]|uniref:Ribosomal protein L11 methyltransferase n=1 Tax=Formicincola oecophyllae TaxID=2558361 RepID=A0A4Y6UDC7_9PROT|nr:50S ribosomal protein L11 methyltransferase [Formicincola oecophyllae]QDH14506.1 50S ribosomal protein L11 methyltransferase [Formicincola oecophyllae]
MAPRFRGARHPKALETLSLTVPEEAVALYEAALLPHALTVGMFEADDEQKFWRLEAVREAGQDDGPLQAALMLAGLVSGESPAIVREATAPSGWIEKTRQAFPPQDIGKRFRIAGTHLENLPPSQRLTIRLDAGAAFGSGEHQTTRGCLVALEAMAWRKPARILDMGCGSGILAIGAAMLLNKPVLAVDIDPRSVEVTRENAALNHITPLVKAAVGDGWHTPAVRTHAPYDLVFANILARPLCRMAPALAGNLLAGGTAILAGLLVSQARQVITAHQAQGMILERIAADGPWCILTMRKGSVRTQRTKQRKGARRPKRAATPLR